MSYRLTANPNKTQLPLLNWKQLAGHCLHLKIFIHTYNHTTDTILLYKSLSSICSLIHLVILHSWQLIFHCFTWRSINRASRPRRIINWHNFSVLSNYERHKILHLYFCFLNNLFYLSPGEKLHRVVLEFETYSITIGRFSSLEACNFINHSIQKI